jgi:hypothetical protein
MGSFSNLLAVALVAVSYAFTIVASPTDFATKRSITIGAARPIEAFHPESKFEVSHLWHELSAHVQSLP